MQLRQHYPGIQARNAEVIAVSFEPRDRLFQLARQVRTTFQLLSDPERDIYRAYGLTRGSFSQLLSPGTVLAYVKLLARGRLYHIRRSDLRQMGGDFVIDADGVVRYQHRSAAPHDRPSVQELMNVIDAL